jgi:RNA-directed DNA polymerase
MARVVGRGNPFAARRRVKRHAGGPGIDGMTVEEWPGCLRQHWPRIRAALVAGTYRPQPVKRAEIPKPGGGVRGLGVPPVRDRFIRQAGPQVLQPEGDNTFSESGYGFRPERPAHQAVARAPRDPGEGRGRAADLGLEKFFARVSHGTLMRLVTDRITDRRVWQLLGRDLQAGALTEGGVAAAVAGTPQGGPRSPLAADLLLDGLDQALEQRGHRFVRCADDRNISVKSVRAGQRVLARAARFLERRLKLRVNGAKGAVGRPWRRTVLGFALTGRRPNRRRVSGTALQVRKQGVRRVTARTRGVSAGRVGGDRRRYPEGRRAYVGFTDAPSRVKELGSWLRRRRRGYLWKPGGRRRCRERRRRGVSQDLAGDTVTSAHGPWRLSRSPALATALPGGYSEGLGRPRLHQRPRRRLNPPNRRRRDPYVRWCGRGEVARPPPIPIRASQFGEFTF